MDQVIAKLALISEFLQPVRQLQASEWKLPHTHDWQPWAQHDNSRLRMLSESLSPCIFSMLGSSFLVPIIVHFSLPLSCNDAMRAAASLLDRPVQLSRISRIVKRVAAYKCIMIVIITANVLWSLSLLPLLLLLLSLLLLLLLLLLLFFFITTKTTASTTTIITEAALWQLCNRLRTSQVKSSQVEFKCCLFGQAHQTKLSRARSRQSSQDTSSQAVRSSQPRQSSQVRSCVIRQAKPNQAIRARSSHKRSCQVLWSSQALPSQWKRVTSSSFQFPKL